MIFIRYQMALLLLLCPWSETWAVNLIENSSFEAGIDYRFSVGRWYIDGLPSAEMDGDSVHGQYSLKYPFSRIAYSRAPKTVDGAVIRASQSIALEAGRRYTFSLYVKTDHSTDGKLVLITDGTGLKMAADKSIRISKKWRRVSLSYTPVISQNVYWEVHAQSSRPGYIWLDALQLEAGKLTPYQPAYPVEAGITSDAPGKIYTTGNVPIVNLRIYKNGTIEEPDMPVRLAVYGLSGNLVHDQELTPMPAPDSGVNIPLELPALENGIYHCELTDQLTGRHLGELNFSILPQPRNVLPGNGSFGAYTTIAPEPLEIMRRLGFTWIGNLTSNGRIISWNMVEMKPGQFLWYDDDISMAREAGFELMFNLEPCSTPSWASELPQKTKIKKWQNYVREMVEHYGSVVKFWTIGDEVHDLRKTSSKINCWGSPAEYAIWHAVGYETIKAVDPTANVIFNARAEFARDVFKSIPASMVDVLAVNAYHLPPWLKSMKAVAEKYAIKRMWAPGIAVQNSSYYRSHNGINVRKKIYDNYWRDRSRELAIDVVTTLGLGYEKLFHYSATYVGNTNDYSLFEADSGLKPVGAQFGALAWLLDGVEQASQLDMVLVGRGLQAYRIDRRDGQTVFALWGAAAPDQQLVLRETGIPEVYDAFANSLPVRQQDSNLYIPMGRDPVFLKVPRQRADALQRVLENLSLYMGSLPEAASVQQAGSYAVVQGVKDDVYRRKPNISLWYRDTVTGWIEVMRYRVSRIPPTYTATTEGFEVNWNTGKGREAVFVEPGLIPAELVEGGSYAYSQRLPQGRVWQHGSIIRCSGDLPAVMEGEAPPDAPGSGLGYWFSFNNGMTMSLKTSQVGNSNHMPGGWDLLARKGDCFLHRYIKKNDRPHGISLRIQLSRQQ